MEKYLVTVKVVGTEETIERIPVTAYTIADAITRVVGDWLFGKVVMADNKTVEVKCAGNKYTVTIKDNCDCGMKICGEDVPQDRDQDEYFGPSPDVITSLDVLNVEVFVEEQD